MHFMIVFLPSLGGSVHVDAVKWTKSARALVMMDTSNIFRELARLL